MNDETEKADEIMRKVERLLEQHAQRLEEKFEAVKKASEKDNVGQIVREIIKETLEDFDTLEIVSRSNNFGISLAATDRCAGIWITHLNAQGEPDYQQPYVALYNDRFQGPVVGVAGKNAGCDSLSAALAVDLTTSRGVIQLTGEQWSTFQIMADSSGVSSRQFSALSPPITFSS